MKTALIDLGSNTIKLAAYETDGKSFSQFHYELDYTYVIGHVEDSRLTKKGVDAICQTLLKFRQKADELGCDELCCFSTASLRYIENQAEVIREVLHRTGIEITPISGEQEAYYNFLSMKTVAGSNFLGGDLGGGSIQLFLCEEDSLQYHQSFPLGGLKLYTEFVSGIIPAPEEAEAISYHAADVLSRSELHLNFTKPDLFMMGGSVKLIQELFGRPDFSAKDLWALTDSFLRNPEEAERKIEAITPERVKTILPAMLVIGAVCCKFEIQTIHYTTSSVREGYFIEHFTNSNQK